MYVFVPCQGRDLILWPDQIGLDVPYTPLFNSAAPPTTLRNLSYERAAVLLNLAALYSQLAASQDRSTAPGLKQMIAHYQVGLRPCC